MLATGAAAWITHESERIKAELERAFAGQPAKLAAVLQVLQEQRRLAEQAAEREVDKVRYAGGAN